MITHSDINTNVKKAEPTTMIERLGLDLMMGVVACSTKCIAEILELYAEFN